MSGKPTRGVMAAEAAVLVGAVAVAVSQAGRADWDLLLIGTLLLVAVIGDMTAVDTANSRVKLSSSFLAIVTATAFGGVTPGVIVGLASIVVGWLWKPYAGHFLLINLTTYAVFPLVAGLAFHGAVGAAGISQTDPTFYLFVFALFAAALVVDFVMIAGYISYLEDSSFLAQVRTAFLPLLPSELASSLLSIGIAFLYVRAGTAAVALFGVVLLTFQYLIGALLVSQQRAAELEVRATQLAGFQVGLLSALLRTLDLRDRMTARHSAAVARYTREVAAEIGLSEEEQDLAHTAGLLHDIGKFVLPDRILKSDVPLSDSDWKEIQRHPYEGARIVSQIDGYQPVGEIILAHHERIDGHGYPRGLIADEIPEIARIISICDTYDVMTARDSYREPVSPIEAIAELRAVAGAQLDARLVEVFVEVLSRRDIAYRHGEDADFEAELAIERRTLDYMNARRHVRPLPGPLA